MSFLPKNGVKEFIASTPCRTHWDSIGVKHHHGIALPLFSLRTEQSAGIGEYLDLPEVIEWCASLGFDILQFLPLNDNGNGASPYSSISAFALNPLHISLAPLEGWQGDKELAAIYQELKSQNLVQRVQYGTLYSLKNAFLWGLFKRQGASVASSKEYLKFKNENPWLLPYALFRSLKMKTHWASWQIWEEGWRNPSDDGFQKLLEENRTEVEYCCFLQFLCRQQLLAVKALAAKLGVFLKGDIPILISKESADVWRHPSVFDISYSAGAPPDMYNPNGQDWGFPVYNWPELEKSNYHWWTERLKSASCYFDLYRIDHVVGFYRIWAIHLGSQDFARGFIPKEEALWIPHGEKILKELIASSGMLPIGEDLGTVPPPVRVNLKKLGISGTKVMRWERKWEEDKSFIPFNEYEPLSMTTVSTHDSETLKLWWQYNPEEAEAFARFKGWEFRPELRPSQHREILADSHHTSSLFHINLLQEYLALVPGMSWENPEDERINLPGTISEKNWSYKFRPTVEQIVSSGALAQLMSEMIPQKR